MAPKVPDDNNQCPQQFLQECRNLCQDIDKQISSLQKCQKQIRQITLGHKFQQQIMQDAIAHQFQKIPKKLTVFQRFVLHKKNWTNIIKNLCSRKK